MNKTVPSEISTQPKKFKKQDKQERKAKQERLNKLEGERNVWEVPQINRRQG